MADEKAQPQFPPPGLLVRIEVVDTRTDRKLTSQKLIDVDQWEQFSGLRSQVLRAYLSEQSDAVMAAAHEQGVI